MQAIYLFYLKRLGFFYEQPPSLVQLHEFYLYIFNCFNKENKFIIGALSLLNPNKYFFF